MRDYLLSRHLLLLTVIFGLFLVCPLMAQTEDAEPMDTAAAEAEPLPEPPPPAKLTSVEDSPNDHGHSVDLSWELSPIDDGSGNVVMGYEIWRAEAADGRGEFKMRRRLPYGVTFFSDRGDKPGGPDPMPNGKEYWYKIRTIGPQGVYSESAVVGPVVPEGEWFHTGKTPVAVAVVVFFFFTVYFIFVARSGKELYVRPLSGISAVDEAIGRATEMGKPIMYVLGLGTASDIATICSFTILSRVSKKVAMHQSSLMVPCYDPIVMTVAQEVVKNAYTEAGRPDSYEEDSVFFVTQSQFAYVAAVNGMMLRERPASNFYLGMFHAESLLLAETGSLAGSIQISGTDQVAQLPFFIVACDYTLIGEELYAASAYLSGEPTLLGSLKAEDWGKGIFIALVIVGVVAATTGWQQFIDWLTVRL
ncbi:MAG: hypothetical protein GF404_05210 [candidate division Zixibacteria bacterium]|nr:hypothetical protein [candidate division Zixibacteria bacterium]